MYRALTQREIDCPPMRYLYDHMFYERSNSTPSHSFVDVNMGTVFKPEDMPTIEKLRKLHDEYCASEDAKARTAEIDALYAAINRLKQQMHEALMAHMKDTFEPYKAMIDARIHKNQEGYRERQRLAKEEIKEHD